MSANSKDAAFGYRAFHPREVESLGVRELSGQQIKLYSIRYGNEPMRWEAFFHGIERAAHDIPPPDVAAGRPGLGFAIAHQGATADYLVICWWANENELPMRLFVREEDDWREAAADESICVWDLEVLWFERNAYVETVLGSNHPDAASDYLEKTLRIAAG